MEHHNLPRMAGMDMGSSSSNVTCTASMIWNWDTIDTCFLASTWHVTTKGMFAVSCIGVALLGMSLEFLRRVSKDYEESLQRQFTRHALSALDNPGSSCNAPANIITYRASPIQQVIRAVLHVAQFGTAYITMLIAMYYNGYMIISIFIGAFLGKLFFDWGQYKVVLGQRNNQGVLGTGPVPGLGLAKGLNSRLRTRQFRNTTNTNTNSDDEEHLRNLVDSNYSFHHEGHAKLDAVLLYVPDGRDDVEPYKVLYVLLPEVVRTIDYAPTLDALDKHATDHATKYKEVKSAYEEAFQTFIRALEESGFPSGWMDEPESPVCLAHRGFRKATKFEVILHPSPALRLMSEGYLIFDL